MGEGGVVRPDEISVDVFVRMPSRSSVLQPFVWLAAGGVNSPVEDHLHPPVSSVRQLPGDFILASKESKVNLNFLWPTLKSFSLE